jgi:hypothetical protein
MTPWNETTSFRWLPELGQTLVTRRKGQKPVRFCFCQWSFPADKKDAGPKQPVFDPALKHIRSSLDFSLDIRKQQSCESLEFALGLKRCRIKGRQSFDPATKRI